MLKFKLASKVAALDSLAEHLGLKKSGNQVELVLRHNLRVNGA